MQTLRIFFTKTGEAAYISHLDLQRVMARALKKSGLPVWYSQGFNPHIYMSFALPLPLGQESETEAVDCKTESEEQDFSAFLPPLNWALPRGIRAQSIALPKYKPAEIARAEYWFDYGRTQGEIQEILEKYWKMPEAPVLVKRKKTEETVDLKNLVKILPVQPDGTFMAVLPAGSVQNINPFLFAQFLQEQFGLPQNAANIIRKRVLIQNGEVFC